MKAQWIALRVKLLVAIVSSASEYEGASYTQEQFNQMELNDLVRDLALSKELSEVLASCSNEKNA